MGGSPWTADDAGSSPAGAPWAPTGVPYRFSLPLPPADLVVRPRLLDLLSQGARGPATCVGAPAGTGKTVLVSSWVHTGLAPGPVTWLTVADGEDPAAFWSYLVEGLGHHGLDARGLPSPTGTTTEPLVPALAARVAAAREPVVLVLDDADHLGPHGVGAELAGLVRQSGGCLRLVLLSRADPVVPLHLLRLAGGLTEVRAADLAFTPEESRRLLGAHLRLDDDQHRRLHARARGWPVGLRYAAMALAGEQDVDAAIDDFTGEVGDVAEYLVSEVLDTHPGWMRDALLRCSVAEDLTPGLVQVLTGRPNGRRVLDRMARGNAFVQPVAGRPGCYRMQPLFRQFLRAQLAFEVPGLLGDLERTEARWLVADGRLADGLRRSVTSGRWDDAAGDLVDGLRLGALLVGRDRSRLTAVLAGLPPEVPGAPAALVRACLTLSTGDRRGCRSHLDAARAASVREEEGRRRACTVGVALVRAVCDDDLAEVLRLARASGDDQLVEDALAAAGPGSGSGGPVLTALPSGRSGPSAPRALAVTPPTAGALVVEPLTAKEREVLGHLADLLTTEEIARTMFVSVNTVRTHVRGVLRKLGVQRRHEAVRRAWELGVLPRAPDQVPRPRAALVVRPRP